MKTLATGFRYIFTLFSFIIISSAVMAQTADIRGFVYEKQTGEPVIFTNVYLKGTTYGAATDVNGFYSISKVPPGSYTLMITYIGFDSLQLPITVKAGEILTKKLFLEKSAVKMKTFEVSAEKQEQKTEVKVSVNKITPKEIKQIPTVGGEPDLAQYLQVLPGVIFTGDQGGQLYIRGGSPIQNKVLMDGMIIYNPFHSIGLFSVFDADIIRNADVYTGGFGAQYGGRVSSVMDITTRDGNKTRHGGKVSVSPFGAKALLEGPLKKLTEDNNTTASYIFSAKNSYLEQTSKILYSYVDTGGLPFNFLDLYGKVSLNSPNGSKLNLFGFNFRDQVKYRSVSDLQWNSSGVGSNFVLIPSGSPILIQGNFAYSKYGISLSEENRKPRTSDIDGFNLGLDFTYHIDKNELNYGIEVLGFKTTFDFYNSVNRQISQEENTTELAGFLRYKITAGKLLIDPSFRMHYYASLNEVSPEPRLGMKYNATDRLRLKLAGGLYSQNLISANSDRDVVNLFYGFLSGPDNLQSTFIEKDGSKRDVTTNLQKSRHAIVGFEYDITSRIDINVETYYKGFNQLTNINRNKLYEDNSANSSKPDALKKDFIVETGAAKGIDFRLKYDYKRLYLWAVYSLAFVDRWDGSVEYVPHFDRRHNMNLVGSYTFGKALDWEFDARWNLGSGFPFSQTQGFYEKLDFQDGLSTNYVNANGALAFQYADVNAGRLPYYHRLDINLKKKFVLTENSTFEANVGVTNAYNRENIFYFDRIKYSRVNQLPIMPSFGLNLTF